MHQSLNDDINLLIVDDRPDNIMALEYALEGEQLTIFTTTSPNNVIQMCIDNNISIALIDVKMPEIDGFELLDMIKGNFLTQHIMVILITGYSMNSEHVVKGLSKGAVDYLFKPLDLHITIAKVKSLITVVNYQREVQRKNDELENYQEKLYEAINQTEKSKVNKDNFLANMSHEIRSPLNAIVGLTYLLKDTTANDDQLEIVKLMEYSSKALLGIVNEILESAKIDSGKIEIVRSKTNIVRLVQNICDLTRPMAEEKGLKLICDIDKNAPKMIMADYLRINQILMNLISNSIKFTNTGNVLVQLKLIEKDQENAVIELIVKDTGIGIAQSSIDKIFTRFEQVEDKTWQKFGGTGLGLSIVKRLIEIKGGTLKVESELGAGATFIFSNSYKLTDETEEIEDAHLSLSNKFDDILVLLADDNTASQYVITNMLKAWNIKVDIAVNGLEAFLKAKNNDYNLILMDSHMPIMNGYEATRKIRNEITGAKKDIPIISFSASVIEKEKQAARIAGVNDFIDKPFDPEMLYNKILRFIGRKALHA